MTPLFGLAILRDQHRYLEIRKGGELVFFQGTPAEQVDRIAVERSFTLEQELDTNTLKIRLVLETSGRKIPLDEYMNPGGSELQAERVW